MYNVIICCDSASSLYDRLCAVRHYFEAPVFGGEERPLNLLETGRVSQISAQAPILILPKALHEPVIGSGAVFAVIANSDFFQAEELRRQFPGAQILTCGMHQQDALTFSSFDGEQAVISLQAALVTLGVRELLPQEFPLFRREDTKRFDLLACAALLLLCGKSSQLPGITL